MTKKTNTKTKTTSRVQAIKKKLFKRAKSERKREKERGLVCGKQTERKRGRE